MPGHTCRGGAKVGEFVRLETDGAVATIRLDRPPMNAINGDLLRDLREAATEATMDDAIRAVVLYGGEKLFAACADLRFAHEGAQLGQPEIKIGIIPGAGGTQRLPRLVGPSRAKDIIFSGRFVKADEAERIGLVDRVVPGDDDVYQAALDAARQYAEGPTAALRAAKVAINWGVRSDFRTGLILEREAFSGLFATEDQKEGMRAFVEKDQAKFTGR